MMLREFNPQWAWIVTQWLTNQEKDHEIRIGMNNEDLDPISFRQLSNQPTNRVYFIFREEMRQPLGMVVLSDIDMNSKTGRIWYVLGDSNSFDESHITEAVNELVKNAFYKLGLSSITAWCFSDDLLSKEVLRNNHFNFIGKRRQCHLKKGQLEDKLLFDLLAQEYQDFICEPIPARFMPYHERSSLQNLSH